MQAALLYELTGDPDGDTLESKLDGEFPALDVERTAYLDGKTLHHGTAAARIEERWWGQPQYVTIRSSVGHPGTIPPRDSNTAGELTAP